MGFLQELGYCTTLKCAGFDSLNFGFGGADLAFDPSPGCTSSDTPRGTRMSQAALNWATDRLYKLTNEQGVCAGSPNGLGDPAELSGAGKSSRGLS